MDAAQSFGEMLPWLKKYRDAVIVIKVGGHAMVDPVARSTMIKDIVTLKFLGAKPVVVHGGGPEIDAMMKRMGKAPKFVSGLRVTDEETLEIVRMVLVGNVNADIVTLVSKYGGNGAGIIGNDGNLIVARRKAPEKAVVDGKETEVDYGWVGETERINPGILNMLLENEFIPVISPIGYDSEGNCLNINADTVAGDIAAAIKATSLVSLTDVDGVMLDPAKRETLISQLTVAQCYDLIDKGVISKGMIPKILSSIAVIKGGLKSVHIINGNIPHALLQELFTDQGIGTCILP
ncbi:MAG TPA: acetylglutamate kinase [Methanocella sp.]|nr:acetylglutamate kinase [Methanocella sp.]